MTQLILDLDGTAIALPESIKGGYTAYEEDLTVEVEMISGRLVRELRGTVWMVNYQYGFFSDLDRPRVIQACRKGRKQAIICSFLPPEGGDMITSKFCVTSFTEPKFMWSKEGKPLWGDFSVSLREERPH